MPCTRRAFLGHTGAAALALAGQTGGPPSDIEQATREYEAWLARYLELVPADLELKHARMSTSPAAFLRATFYRWVQLWQQVCPDLARAPAVLAVGDLHAENFGTWLDADGRPVWGINDFDEASPMAYPADLTRLATSVQLAINNGYLASTLEVACQAILSGYAAGWEAGGRPFILTEEHKFLRNLVLSLRRDPAEYWKRLEAALVPKDVAPPAVRAILESLMPERGLTLRVARRVSGLGSLGRQRFVAVAEWRGGRVAREAKPLAPSACLWAGGGRGKREILYPRILSGAVRCPDPFVQVRGHWVVRRIGPEIFTLEMEFLPKDRDEPALLHSMGWETANVHLGSRESGAAVRGDLRNRPSNWLLTAARAMAQATIKDWEEWRAKHPAPAPVQSQQ